MGLESESASERKSVGVISDSWLEERGQRIIHI